MYVLFFVFAFMAKFPFQAISQVTWHNKGDYFATVLPQGSLNKLLYITRRRFRSRSSLSIVEVDRSLCIAAMLKTDRYFLDVPATSSSSNIESPCLVNDFVLHL